MLDDPPLAFRRTMKSKKVGDRARLTSRELRLIPDGDFFEKRTDGGRGLRLRTRDEFPPSLDEYYEPWDPLSSYWSEFIQPEHKGLEINWEEVPVLNLSGLSQADPGDLKDALEHACWFLGVASRAINGLTPPFLVSWFAASAEERALQLEFHLRWDDDYGRSPDEAPLLFLTQDGVKWLGSRSLDNRALARNIEEHFDTMVNNRLITYHAFGEGAEPSAKKKLGKLALALHKIGFLVDRGYPPEEELVQLGLDSKDSGRPKLWESVPAFARSLYDEQAKAAAAQYMLL